MVRVTLQEMTDQVAEGISLQTDEAEVVARLLVRNDVPASEKEAFLTTLADKGETPAEVAGFARCFRALAHDPGLDEFASKGVDLVGTGGDGVGSFNISTASSFVVAAAGVPVLKHGNRSITSKCGSADLIEAVGVDLNASNDLLRASLRELNFGFLFAPAFHPVFKDLMPVRQSMASKGRRSIFNILGPLINPANPSHQLLGVFAKNWVKPMAGALDSLNVKRGLVVHGTLPDGRGMDELTCAGTNTIAVLDSGAVTMQQWDIGEFGLAPCSQEALQGGSLSDNLQILDALVSGKAPRGLTDTVSLNAGAALWAAGQAASVGEGVARAQELLGSGAVGSWLQQLKTFYSA